MGRFLVFLSAMFICVVAFATTVNLNWLVDGATFAQTTCETGGNFALPSTTPTKYGYTFSGWIALIKGTVDQNGTPSPTNPIEPVFYQDSNGMILRAINDSVADTYNPSTGKITRRVGVKVLDGTEEWVQNEKNIYCFGSADIRAFENPVAPISTHFTAVALENANMPDNSTKLHESVYFPSKGVVFIKNTAVGDVTNFKTFLAEQYANGTPVTVYYPLATPTEEVWNGQ